MTTYGLLSFIYLIIVSVGISLFLMDQWLPLGLMVLLMTLYGKLMVPLYQLIKHLRGSAAQGNRRRAVGASATIGVLLLLFIAVLPIPDAIRMRGIVKANSSSNISLLTSGQLDALYVHHGSRLHKGQLIASFTNPDLETEIVLADAAKAEAFAQLRQALHKSRNDLESLNQKLDSLDVRIRSLKEQRSQLEVRADQDGEWVASELNELKGTWLQRGHTLGEVVDRSSFRFVAVVPQEQADILFKQSFEQTELRLAGQADGNVVVPQIIIIPYQSERLPSVALGWLGGGEIAVNTNEPSGEKAKESFFLLQTELPAQQLQGLTVLHGLSGTIRLKLPSQTLATQIYRAIKQLVQKRYAV